MEIEPVRCHSTPDDYDADMDCDTFDVDDDNDGVNDGPDPHPLNECYWSDNDQDGIADYNNEGGCVAHMTSFESATSWNIHGSRLQYHARLGKPGWNGGSQLRHRHGVLIGSRLPRGRSRLLCDWRGIRTVTVPAGGYAAVQPTGHTASHTWT